ncbi:MAG: hypothetical protein C4321_11175, partial [Chloroflexota bacterium]
GLLSMGLSALLNWATTPAPPQRVISVVARPGDTLWKWANAYPRSGYILDRVENIAAVNGLKANEPLVPG